VPLLLLQPSGHGAGQLLHGVKPDAILKAMIMLRCVILVLDSLSQGDQLTAANGLA
jgi:hypothetical protein